MIYFQELKSLKCKSFHQTFFSFPGCSANPWRPGQEARRARSSRDHPDPGGRPQVSAARKTSGRLRRLVRDHDVDVARHGPHLRQLAGANCPARPVRRPAGS
jgi:hypothetical protein